MKMSLVSSVLLLLPAMFSVKGFAQSNIERAVVYEINKIRAASCLDSFYYNPEISASCRENALKHNKAGNDRIEESEEHGKMGFSERFFRYLPERFKKRIACNSAMEWLTYSNARLEGYPDDVAAKEIAESIRESLLNHVYYRTYFSHKDLERKIGISVIPNENNFDIVVVALFMGTKDGVPTITPAWKPVERKVKPVKTVAGSNPEIIRYIRENLDTFNKKTIPVEVEDVHKKIHQLALKGFKLNILRHTFNKMLPENSTFHMSSGSNFNNQISKPLCFYSYKKIDGFWELTMVTGSDE